MNEILKTFLLKRKLVSVEQTSASIPNRNVLAVCNNSDCDTPRKVALKRQLASFQRLNAAYQKKLKVCIQAKRRLIKRTKNLQTALQDCKRKNILTANNLNVLESLSKPIYDLVERQCAKSSSRSLPVKYSPELRTFALTLHFYSPKAYSYVRKKVNLCLPHPRTLGKWYQHVDGRPGFTKEAINALRLKNSEATASGKNILCSLLMDEMAIRQHTEFDGQRHYGFVDMGVELKQSDKLALAKEAFTFMLVAINSHWKLPVGYFLTDGLNGVEKANLVRQCLVLVHDTGVSVMSLTFDGAAANLSMATSLGCSLAPGSCSIL